MKQNKLEIKASSAKGILAKTLFVAALATGVLTANGCELKPYHCPRENSYQCCGLWDYFEGADDYCPDYRGTGY